MEMPTNQVAANSQPLTTFVQVDTAKFKEVVQRLTGSSKPAPDTIHEASSALHQHQSPEEGFSSSRSGYRVLQSSPLSTPTKCFSSLSLGENESGGESSCPDLNTAEEEKAIRERRFYLHPSPRSRPQFNEPELLSLFPLTSPKIDKEA